MSFIKILLGDKKENECCSIEIKEVKSGEESCCENDKKDNKCCV
ncbi:hypothetical protein [Fictibacillus arsenicus]|jgi:hypothetical protein|nr:hypothetical protein [Fictibacillus arsenicus]